MLLEREPVTIKPGSKERLNRRYRRSSLLFAQLAISFGAIYLSARKVDFHDWISIFTSIDLISWLYIFGSILSIMLSFLVRALLWRWLLNYENPVKVGYFQGFRVLMIGFFANNILPAKAGEFVRSYMIKKKCGLQQSYVLGTIFLERVFDFLNLFLFLFVGISVFKTPAWLRQVQLGGLAFLFFLVLCIVLLLKWKGGISFMPGGRFGDFVESKVNSLLSILNTFRVPIQRLFRNKRVFAILLLSMLTWMLAVVSIFFSGKALNIELDFVHYFLILGVINLGALVPAAPGSVGVYQYLTVLVLPLYGISHTLSFAFGVLSHVTFYLVSSIVGLLFLFYENVSIFKIYGLQRTSKPQTDQ